MRSTWILWAALLGLSAVAAGAFGAHGLSDPKASEYFAKAAQYQMIHALALLWLARSPAAETSRALRVARWSFVIGVIAFSGSLYALALADIASWLWPVTPAGGLALLLGWAALAVGSRAA